MQAAASLISIASQGWPISLLYIYISIYIYSSVQQCGTAVYNRLAVTPDYTWAKMVGPVGHRLEANNHAASSGFRGYGTCGQANGFLSTLYIPRDLQGSLCF